MKIPLNSIGKLLHKYRVKKNFTQEQMAKLLDCTQSQYSIWENGGKPSKLREKLIRETLNVRLD